MNMFSTFGTVLRFTPSSTRAFPHTSRRIIHSYRLQESYPKRLRDFDLKGGVYIVTGGAQGLGLCLAEGLVESGGKVYCLDRLPKPNQEYREAESRILPEFGGSLSYKQVDVRDSSNLNSVIMSIADEHNGIDGLIAAAGVQKVCDAVNYPPEDIADMLSINYTGVFLTATACARAMFKYKKRGSMVLIGSMSGLVANKGLISPVYNSSKAAVLQLTRNLAMEWGRVDPKTGEGGIRVNSLSPGHIVTPMVEKNFEDDPGLKELWEKENMLGRLSKPEEFKGAALFMLSRASSFMTANNLVIDGGHTAW
ncbi:oxidoreductase [Patellaria atrata CBS 101060]|uniref:Oxidoreductase n=1 Tax=Patellaria atrata CBS 101060 TaxID=1346257 RepID=A0A9P4SDY4_9PEZI|nr:oxidoreductase [Patellaria atrata CBS 101060]